MSSEVLHPGIDASLCRTMGERDVLQRQTWEDIRCPILSLVDKSRGIEKKKMEMKNAVELMLAKDRSLDGGPTLLQPYESQVAPIARITVWGILERPT